MTPILVVVLLWKMFQVLKKKFFLEKKIFVAYLRNLQIGARKSLK